MSLRSTCIEAMAAAIDVPGDQTDAAAALDALLGVLEEHAAQLESFRLVGESLTMFQLLAVLREDT